MATTEKIRRDIEKVREKITEQQKRLRALEAQLAEEENLEIVRRIDARPQLDGKGAIVKSLIARENERITDRRDRRLHFWREGIDDKVVGKEIRHVDGAVNVAHAIERRRQLSVDDLKTDSERQKKSKQRRIKFHGSVPPREKMKT